MNEELKKGWEREFDEKYYNKNNPSGLNTTGFEFQKHMIDDVKSFISSLLAKQQEEFVKIAENILTPHGFESDDTFTENAIQEVKERCLADIKSKLNKEEPAYIGGVNLTTNDNEISNRLAVTDRNIGMLRQWLNEDRIDDFKKMITNDDIKFWLDIK
jgi:hypothetical protein